MPSLSHAWWVFVCSLLLACGDDTSTGAGGAGGAAPGGGAPGGAAPGGAGTGGAGGTAAIDCEAITELDPCRNAGPCEWLESDPNCPNDSGVSGCFWAACSDCPAMTTCQPVSGGDGADGCIALTSCVAS